MAKTTNINMLPISKEAALVRVKIRADKTARQGGLQIDDVIDYLFDNNGLQYVVVDIHKGCYSWMSNYSLAHIRIPGVSRQYLAAWIDYEDSLGVFVPKTGSFILDLRDETITQNMRIHRGSKYGKDWSIELTLWLPNISVS